MIGSCASARTIEQIAVHHLHIILALRSMIVGIQTALRKVSVNRSGRTALCGDGLTHLDPSSRLAWLESSPYLRLAIVEGEGGDGQEGKGEVSLQAGQEVKAISILNLGKHLFADLEKPGAAISGNRYQAIRIVAPEALSPVWGSWSECEIGSSAGRSRRHSQSAAHVSVGSAARGVDGVLDRRRR